MAPPMTAEEKLEFLLIMIKHSGKFKPDYKAAAAEVGINRPSNVGTKLKKIIEDDGRFFFKDNEVTTVGDDKAPTTPMKDDIPATPKPKARTPKTPIKDGDEGKNSTKKSASKKRKVTEDADESSENPKGEDAE